MDVEKILGLEPLKTEKKESKDLFPIFESAAQDMYPKVPDPEFDYLFTNWGDKEPEKEFQDPKDEPSNQLEKSLKRKKQFSKYFDLSDSQKSIIEKFESLAEADDGTVRLKKKGWQRWNNSDWKNAERKLKVKAPHSEPIVKVDGMKLIDLKPLVVGEDLIRARSNAIVEMKFLDTIYKSFMTAGGPDVEKEEGKEKVYKHIDTIVDKSLEPFKIKTKSPKKYDEDGVIGINYKVEIKGHSYAIHTHFIKSSKVFLFSLWDKEEFRVILMLCEGYLKEDHYLIGIAKSRMKAWMEKSHGSSKSGEDNR